MSFNRVKIDLMEKSWKFMKNCQSQGKQNYFSKCLRKFYFHILTKDKLEPSLLLFAILLINFESGKTYLAGKSHGKVREN